MKRAGILNARLAEIVASMGHTDLLVVADAGLPVPPGLACIDLAVTAEVPRLLDVLAAVRALFPDAAEAYLPHEEFKRLTGRARAVVRTGEVTPYANVILASGVVF